MAINDESIFCCLRLLYNLNILSPTNRYKLQTNISYEQQNNGYKKICAFS